MLIWCPSDTNSFRLARLPRSRSGDRVKIHVPFVPSCCAIRHRGRVVQPRRGAGGGWSAVAINPASIYSRYDWTGFYAGAHVGYGRGQRENDALRSGAGGREQFVRQPLRRRADRIQSFVLVAHVCSASKPTSRFPIIFRPTMSPRRARARRATSRTRSITSARCAAASAMPPTAGWSTEPADSPLSQARFLQTPGAANDQDKVLRMLTGWTAGAGAEVAIAPRWTTRLEYLYSRFGHGAADFPSGTRYESEFDIHTVRLALNRKLDSNAERYGLGASARCAEFQFQELGSCTARPPTSSRAMPAFRSPYIGTNSFTPWAQTRNTWTTTLHRRSALAGRRGLLQPRTAAGTSA